MLKQISLVAALVFSGTLVAEEVPEQPVDREAQTLDQIDTEVGQAEGTERSFEQLDKNGDGALSADEAEEDTHLNAMFLDVDDNNDGQLSSEEYSEWKGGFVD